MENKYVAYYGNKENEHISHYGVRGMRWGVRRYQNKDGSLTPIGKKRYGSMQEKFKNTEIDIKNKLSNKYKKINEKAKFDPREVLLADSDTVKRQAKLSRKENADFGILATDIATEKIRKALKVEPAITKDIVDSAIKSGCKMYKLEDRLKEPNSLATKLAIDVKKEGLSLVDAGRKAYDTLSYTVVSDNDKFVDKYNEIKNNLRAKGYNEISCNNTFLNYQRGQNSYKEGVQCVYEDGTGYRFELSFQTPSSQAAKELKSQFYKNRSVSKKQAVETKILADNVKNPPNINTIKEK